MERGEAKTVSAWSNVAKHVPQRTPKQCRERWSNHVSDTVNRQPWTQEEDETIFREQALLGNKWAAIAQKLPGRTDNHVKNRWHVKKRLGRSSEHGAFVSAPMTCFTITLGEIMHGLDDAYNLIADEKMDAEDAGCVPVVMNGLSTTLFDTTSSSHAAFQEINAMLCARRDAPL